MVAIVVVLLGGGGGSGGTSTTSTQSASSTPRVLTGGIDAVDLPVGVAADGSDVYIADRSGKAVIRGNADSMKQLSMASTVKPAEDVVVAGDRVFVTVPEAHEVLVFDRSLKEVGAIELPAESLPAGITTGDGEVWVAGEGSGAVYEINPTGDPTDPSTVQTLDVGAKEPFGVGVTPDALWVADRAKDRVIRFDRGAGTHQDFTVGDNPKGVAVAGGHVYVANADSGDVTILDEADPGTDPQTVPVKGQPRAIDVLAGRVWVTNGDSASLPLNEKRGWVNYFDEATTKLEGKVKVKGSPEGIGVSSDRVWVATGPEKLARAIEP